MKKKLIFTTILLSALTVGLHSTHKSMAMFSQTQGQEVDSTPETQLFEQNAVDGFTDNSLNDQNFKTINETALFKFYNECVGLGKNFCNTMSKIFSKLFELYRFNKDEFDDIFTDGTTFGGDRLFRITEAKAIYNTYFRPGSRTDLVEFPLEYLKSVKNNYYDVFKKMFEALVFVYEKYEILRKFFGSFVTDVPFFNFVEKIAGDIDQKSNWQFKVRCAFLYEDSGIYINFKLFSESIFNLRKFVSCLEIDNELKNNELIDSDFAEFFYKMREKVRFLRDAFVSPVNYLRHLGLYSWGYRD